MADTKISALANGAPAVATDEVVIARAGANFKLPASAFWTVPSGSQLLLPDGTAAAPSLGFSSDNDGTGTGFYRVVANQIGWASNGNAAGRLYLGNIWIASDTATYSFGAAQDLLLTRDAANTLALRSGVNAQTFNIYNTFTDATTNEYGGLRWSGVANTFELFTEKGSVGGTARGISIRPDSTGSTNIVNENSSNGIQIAPSSAQTAPLQDDVHNLGNSSNRFLSFYLSRSTQGSKSKALTESAATTFVTIAVPQTAGSNFAGGECIYTVYATDTVSGDGSVISGVVKFSAYNKAGTVTSQVADVQTLAATSGGATLTAVITATTSGDNVILQCNALSSLTQTTLSISYRLDMPQPNTVTPA